MMIVIAKIIIKHTQQGQQINLNKQNEPTYQV